MNKTEAWKGLERVTAPPEFDDRLFRELKARIRPDPRVRKARKIKWALSGSAAVLLLAFTALNLFVFKGGPLAGIETGSPGFSAAGDPVRVTESLNYGQEFGSTAVGRTVFLLEQVSDTATPSIIRY